MVFDENLQFFQQFGDLINLHTGKLQPAYDPGSVFGDDMWQPHRVFDRFQRRWRIMRLVEIPQTFTFAPRPTNFVEESVLWMAAAGLINHRFIWRRQQIPFADAACLLSRTAQVNHGRFSCFQFE